MKELRRQLRSPSMILAAIALFVALGGAAYAGFSLPNNSVRTNHLVNGQVKTADLANLAVTNAKINNNAVNSAKIKNGSVELGDLSPGAISSLSPGPGTGVPKLWAVVSNGAGAADATLIRGAGVTQVTELGVGIVRVRFNQQVNNCAWLAGRNGVAAVVEPAGLAQVSLDALGNDFLQVRTRTAAGALVNGNFHLEVLC